MSSVNPTQANNLQVQARQDLEDQIKTNQADREKIAAEHEADMARIKKSYELEKGSNQDRYETSLQSERLSNYDNLRRTKKEASHTEEELVRLKTEREKQLTGQVTSKVADLEKDGTKQVQDRMRKNQILLESANQKALEAENLSRMIHRKNAEEIVKDSEDKIGKLYEAKQQELAFQGTNHQVAVGQIRNQYQGSTDRIHGEYETQLKSLQNKTQNDLNQRRISQATQLGSYSARQDDPFYRLARFDSSFQDAGDRYSLTVRLPEHERDQVKVQVSGQEIQISGTRSTNEKVEVTPGRWVQTSSFQNISERIPLPMPVDPSTLRRSVDGDTVEYTILKYGPNHKQGALKTAEALDRKTAKISQPDFPSDLPKPSIVPDRRNRTLS